jgi:hypothetical protein
MKPETMKSATVWKRELFICLILSVFTVLSVLVQGYYFGGDSDHAELLPAMLQYYNPELFTRDIIYNDGNFSPMLHRLASFMLIYNLSDLSGIDVEILFFIFHVFFRFIFFYLIFKITYMISRSSCASVLAAFISIFFSVLPTISGFKPFAPILVPGMLVMPFVLFSIYLFLLKKYTFSYFVAAVCVYIHIQTGLLLFAILFQIFLFMVLRKKIGLSTTIIPLAVFLVLASYPVIATFMYNLEAVTTLAADSRTQLYEEVALRIPHHAMPSQFTLVQYIFFGSYLFLMIYLTRRYQRRLSLFKFFSDFSLAYILLALVSAFFIEIYPLPAVIKLLPFRASEFISLLFPIVFSTSLVHIFRNLRNLRKNKLLAIVLAGFIVISCSYIWYKDGFVIQDNLKIYDYLKDTPSGDMTEYVRFNTPIDSLFIIPPMNSMGFRYASQRAAVFNWKVAGTWAPKDTALEWVSRAHDFCDLSGGWTGWVAAIEHCDPYYNSLSIEQILGLARKYRADYVIRETAYPLPLPKLYENEEFTLYSVPNVAVIG